MTKTADTLKAMLTENTGIHMLDSGGAYERSWQQNAKRDFAAEPAATITVEEGYIDIRRSTYHFLNECLEFDEAMTLGFEQFCKGIEVRSEHRAAWLTLMEEFVESINAKGIYGEGPPIVTNTYNHDSLLDQVIQYVYFELDEQGYVLLQIHGGCDVRGGYTAPRAFRCNIESSPSIFDDGEALITCRNSEHRWYYSQGGWDVGHYEDEDNRTLDKFPIITGIRSKITEEVLWQDAQGGHCPLCGEVLEVW